MSNGRITRRGFLGVSTAAAFAPVAARAATADPGTTAGVVSDEAKGSSGLEFGSPARVDGPAKVTGSARYAADEVFGADVSYAVLITSAVAKGTIHSIKKEAAQSVPGVRLILDHTNMDMLPPIDAVYPKGQSHTVFQPFTTSEIRYSGQPIAILVADDLETARYAAGLINVDYDLADDGPKSTIKLAMDPPSPIAVPIEEVHDQTFGNVDEAFDKADVVVDAEYETAIEHHNSIELYSCAVRWSPDERTLTVYEPSQWLYGLRAHLAQQLGLEQNAVQVVSRVVGGAFGGKALAMPHTVAAAIAARRIKRTVKLHVTREQMFTIGSYRPGSVSRVKLAAQRNGKLLAVAHDYWAQTSRSDPAGIPGTEATVAMYDAPHVRGRDHSVPTDANAPGPMRAPVEMPSFFALESAMDELAVALDIDPIELRILNEPTIHPTKRVPFSSRSLTECYRRGAELFGWAARDHRPRSMRNGDWLVGWGCASALYPTYVGPASVRMKLRLTDGKPYLEVRLAGQDIGTGLATIVSQVAAASVGLAIEHVQAIIGDSNLPFGSMAAGSRGTASVSPATLMTANKIRQRLLEASVSDARGPFAGRDPNDLDVKASKISDGRIETTIADVLSRVHGNTIEEQLDWAPPGMPPETRRSVQAGTEGAVGPITDTHAMYAFGAQFVEVQIHRRTKVIRAPRMVGVFAAGRIMNRRTAHSQLMGGMIWGLASGLHEETLVDPRSGRYVNGNLAEYLLPVCADVKDVTVEMLDEKDEVVNPLGIKGVGELGVVGVAAAIANAVYHATGRRVRQLPIRLDHLFEAS